MMLQPAQAVPGREIPYPPLILMSHLSVAPITGVLAVNSGLHTKEEAKMTRTVSTLAWQFCCSGALLSLGLVILSNSYRDCINKR